MSYLRLLPIAATSISLLAFFSDKFRPLTNLPTVKAQPRDYSSKRKEKQCKYGTYPWVTDYYGRVLSPKEVGQNPYPQKCTIFPTSRLPDVYVKPNIPPRTILEYDGFLLCYDNCNKTVCWTLEVLRPNRLDYEAPKKLKLRKETRIPCEFRTEEHDFDEIVYDDDDEDENVDDDGYRNPRFKKMFLVNPAHHKLHTKNDALVCTNIVPEERGEKGSIWEDLNIYVDFLRPLHENIYICSGPLYLPKIGKDGTRHVECTYLGRQKIPIPTHFFRVILCEKQDKTFRMECYKIPNAPIQGCEELKDYHVSRRQLEKDAGFMIFHDVKYDMVSSKHVHPEFTEPRLEDNEECMKDDDDDDDDDDEDSESPEEQKGIQDLKDQKSKTPAVDPSCKKQSHVEKFVNGSHGHGVHQIVAPSSKSSEKDHGSDTDWSDSDERHKAARRVQEHDHPIAKKVSKIYEKITKLEHSTRKKHPVILECPSPEVSESLHESVPECTSLKEKVPECVAEKEKVSECTTVKEKVPECTTVKEKVPECVAEKQKVPECTTVKENVPECQTKKEVPECHAKKKVAECLPPKKKVAECLPPKKKVAECLPPKNTVPVCSSGKEEVPECPSSEKPVAECDDSEEPVPECPDPEELIAQCPDPEELIAECSEPEDLIVECPNDSEDSVDSTETKSVPECHPPKKIVPACPPAKKSKSNHHKMIVTKCQPQKHKTSKMTVPKHKTSKMTVPKCEIPKVTVPRFSKPKKTLNHSQIDNSCQVSGEIALSFSGPPQSLPVEQQNCHYPFEGCKTRRF